MKTRVGILAKRELEKHSRQNKSKKKKKQKETKQTKHQQALADFQRKTPVSNEPVTLKKLKKQIKIARANFLRRFAPKNFQLYFNHFSACFR